jgi:hypothetical protein
MEFWNDGILDFDEPHLKNQEPSNTYEENVKTSLNPLDPDPEIIRLRSLFHCSTISSFHESSLNRNLYKLGLNLNSYTNS